MRLGLSVYGTMFGMGINKSSGRPRIRPLELIDRAVELELEGVEIPTELLEGEDIDAVSVYARNKGVFISLETTGCNPDKLAEEIQLTARMGVPTLRTIVGGAKLGGDRRPLAGRWKEYLEQCSDGLRSATKYAEQAKVALAVENHQDIASEELIELCESISSDYFGIAFDTGSTLATADDPVEFAKKAAPFIKHVHLKDYSLYLSEEGFRLVSCSFGQGVIDFPSMFDLFAKACPNVTMAIEVGALEARHVRVFSEDYWTDYPARSAVELVRLVRFVLAHARPSGDWRSPYERGEPVETIIDYENQRLEASIAYLKYILRNYKK